MGNLIKSCFQKSVEHIKIFLETSDLRDIPNHIYVPNLKNLNIIYTQDSQILLYLRKIHHKPLKILLYLPILLYFNVFFNI